MPEVILIIISGAPWIFGTLVVTLACTSSKLMIVGPNFFSVAEVSNVLRASLTSWYYNNNKGTLISVKICCQRVISSPSLE